jgi:glycosyltransferase involved in cell wall biosynthesis
MIKVSFILPVYQVEAYIEKCILSILAIDIPYDNYEIIVVNDGSPDGSKEIVERLQRKYSNIILVNQPNQGVSVARNKGIEISRGKYIMFVDPDDFLATTKLNEYLTFAEEKDLDILLFGRSSMDVNGCITNMCGYESVEFKLFDGIDAYWIKDSKYVVWDSSVGRLYKRQLVNKYVIRFPEGVIHLEDGVFVRKIFAVAQKVSFININLYTVFVRPGSASRNVLDKERIIKYMKGYVDAYHSLLTFKNTYQFNKKQLGLINVSILKYALTSLLIIISNNHYKIFGYAVKYLKRNKILVLDTSFIKNDTAYLNYANAYKISPYFLLLTFKITLLKTKLSLLFGKERKTQLLNIL